MSSFGTGNEGEMDRLAELHKQYLILDVMHAPKFLINEAIKRYNDCLNAEFDFLEKTMEEELPFPEDFLKPKGIR